MPILTKDELIAIANQAIHSINHDHERGALISQIYRGSNKDAEDVINEWCTRLDRLKMLICETFSTEESNSEYL